MKFNNKIEIYEDMLEEGKLKKVAMGTMAALALAGTTPKAQGENGKETTVTKSEPKKSPYIDIVLRLGKRYIGKNEGAKKYIYDDKHPKRRWKKGDPVDGNLTIGVGHLVLPNEIDKFIDGIDDAQMQKLFDKDIEKHLKTARGLFKDFDSYPPYLQVALLDSVYRGEMKSTHKTVKYINAGEWDKVPAEYIDRKDYKDSKAQGEKHGVWKRMDNNNKRFKNYAESLKNKKKKKFNENFNSILNELNGNTLSDVYNIGYDKLMADTWLSSKAQSHMMELVTIDVPKFDKLWKKFDKDFYIGSGESSKKQYQNAIDFFLMTPEERKKEHDADHIDAPEVEVADDLVGVTQGRHRYAVLRDAGFKKFKVAMDQDSIKKAKEMGLLS